MWENRKRHLHAIHSLEADLVDRACTDRAHWSVLETVVPAVPSALVTLLLSSVLRYCVRLLEATLAIPSFRFPNFTCSRFSAQFFDFIDTIWPWVLQSFGHNEHHHQRKWSYYTNSEPKQALIPFVNEKTEKTLKHLWETYVT